MKMIQIFEARDRGGTVRRIEVHPRFLVYTNGSPLRAGSNYSEAELDRFFGTMRQYGVVVKKVGEKDPRRAGLARKHRATLRSNKPMKRPTTKKPKGPKETKTFFGATLTGAIHYLGKRGFGPDEILAALATKGFSVSRNMIMSHIGCAVRGPKKGLKDRTNKHRQVIASFDRATAKKIFALKKETTVVAKTASRAKVLA